MTGIKQDSLISLNDISVFEIFDKAEINISQWLPEVDLVTAQPARFPS